MLRIVLASLVVLGLAGAGLAEEIQGRIKSVDLKKSTITITVGEKERILEVAKEVRLGYMVRTGRLRARYGYQESIGLTPLNEGTPVTVITQTRNEAEIVTQIRTDGYAMSGGGGRGRRR